MRWVLPRRVEMSASDIYRNKAIRLCERANEEPNLDIRTKYKSLAFAYMCLAREVESEILEWTGLLAGSEGAEPKQP